MPIKSMLYWLHHPHQNRLQSQSEIAFCRLALKFRPLVQCPLTAVDDVKTSKFVQALALIECLGFDTNGLTADDQRVFPALKAVVFL